MRTPAEIAFELNMRLAAMSKGGPIPVLVGIHSVVVEDGIASIGFDVMLPHEVGTAVFFFNFELPSCLTSRDDVAAFGRWLVEGDCARGTRH
jgi:hypothetical protein